VKYEFSTRSVLTLDCRQSLQISFETFGSDVSRSLFNTLVVFFCYSWNFYFGGVSHSRPMLQYGSVDIVTDAIKNACDWRPKPLVSRLKNWQQNLIVPIVSVSLSSVVIN